LMFIKQSKEEINKILQELTAYIDNLEGKIDSATFRGFKEKHQELNGRVTAVLNELEHEICLYKRSADYLLEVEEYYEAIFETTGAATILLEEDLTIFRVNSEFERISGYTRDEVEGKLKWPDFLINKDADLTRNYSFLRDVSPEIAPRNYEVKLTDKGGNIKDIYLTVALIAPHSSKKVLSFLDISKQKKTERALNYSVEKLQRILDQAVDALSNTLETRDPYTAGHQREVARLVTSIGQYLGMDEDRLEGLRVAGTLHDFGKINVPAEILNKPSKLDEYEYEIIKTHCQAGYDILKGIEFPWPIAQILLQHHERMDGSGYPFGLSGDEILMEARILAVADVVEAMVADRPYRASLGLNEALAEIKRFRGLRYDPDVVDACIRFFSENKYNF